MSMGILRTRCCGSISIAFCGNLEAVMGEEQSSSSSAGSSSIGAGVPIPEGFLLFSLGIEVAYGAMTDEMENGAKDRI